jgi:transposase
MEQFVSDEQWARLAPLLPKRRRKLQRFRHRWIVERTNAWLLSLRRLVTRYERRAEIYLAFVHVACLLITLRRF